MPVIRISRFWGTKKPMCWPTHLIKYSRLVEILSADFMDEKNKEQSGHTVYGAQHPPLAHLLSTKPAAYANNKCKNNNFNNLNNLQNSIDDAWDIVDINDCCEERQYQTIYRIGEKSNMLQNTNKLINIVPGCHSTGLFDKPIYPSLKNLMHTPPNTTTKFGPGIGKRISSPTNNKTNNLATGSSNTLSTKGDQRQNYYQTASQYLASEQESAKIEKFSRLMNAQNLDTEELIKLCWSGIHPKYRPITWKILSHYIPASIERRKETLDRKRKEYFAFVQKYYPARLEELHKDMYRQIHIDIPRMNPLIDLFQQSTVQNMFERILFIWAMRHPASGYVQGINDLVTPFFVVFLSEYVPSGASIDEFVIDTLEPSQLADLEADSFWCVSNLLDGIQDNYTFAQPGIQEKVNSLKHLVSRTNVPLFNHLRENEVEFLQFAFRWMNNLLMREIPLKCTIRLWDTYLSEPNGFSNFHLYVCVAFLNQWSERILKEKDFQGIMLLIQNLPTKPWGEQEISLILAEAYKLKYMFADSPRHLMPSTIHLNTKSQSIGISNHSSSGNTANKGSNNTKHNNSNNNDAIC